MSREKKFYFSVCDDVKNIEKLEQETGHRNLESVSYVWIDVLREKYPDVLKRIGNFVYDIDGLSRWKRKKIESEVGVNAGRMWEDEAMIKNMNNILCDL